MEMYLKPGRVVRYHRERYEINNRANKSPNKDTWLSSEHIVRKGLKQGLNEG